MKPLEEHQYLDRSEEIEGISDFVAAGERSDSNAVSGFETLDFDHNRKGITLHRLFLLLWVGCEYDHKPGSFVNMTLNQGSKQKLSKTY